MAAQNSIQHHPSRVAGAFQPAPPVASGVMSGPSVPFQPGNIPWVNPILAFDSSQQDPSTWDEVHLLQEALKPSIRSFTRITSRPPPCVPGSPWLSYASQFDILQRESDRYWSADRRPGDPPRLAGLATWRGGILMVGKAGFDITEEMTEEFTHAKLRGFRDCDRPPGRCQDHFREQAHNQFQSLLLAADARRERLKVKAAVGSGQQDASEDITETLDNIVARDPERYLAWLSTMGYFYFTMSSHNPHGLSWEEWCAWNAPVSFEICCKPASAVWPSSGPGSIDRTKYGLGDRPTISLEEAKRGNRRGLEFRNTVNGMEVLQKEKTQYCMIRGEATSREAAAHYHALQGEDVWLFEPAESF